MLAPRCSSAFVCFRCEYNLARAAFPALAHRPHVSFSSSARRRDEFTGADENDAGRAQPRYRKSVSEHPLGKLRRRKGKAPLRETTARLGVKTLGNEAEILVLKEVGGAPSEYAADSGAAAALESQDAPGILASIQQEEARIGPEEINKQLETLRPRTTSNPNDPQYISQRTFTQLKKTLYSGFTVQQLTRYYVNTTGLQASAKSEAQVANMMAKSKGKHILHRTEWHPGTTPISVRLPDGQVKALKARPINKTHLVDQILRDAWNVVLLEEIEAPGELEILLKPWQVMLLNAGVTPTALDRIGAARKVKLEIFRSHNALRITADKSTAEYTADDIESLLQATTVERFFLQPWIPFLDKTKVPKGKLIDIIPADALQKAAELSQTVVQPVSDDTIIIRALDSTSAQLAQNSLINLLPLVSKSTSTINTQRLSDDTFLVPTVFKSSLEHRSRLLELGRWSQATSKITGTNVSIEQEPVTPSKVHHPVVSHNELSIAADHTTEVLQDYLSSNPYRSLAAPQADKWKVNNLFSLRAAYGHMLYPMNGQPITNPSSLGSPSDFAGSFPGFAKLLIAEGFKDSPRTSEPILEYHFTPSPKQQNALEDPQSYPDLHISVYPKKIADGHDVRPMVSLKFNDYYHDVLLPDYATDIRFKTFEKISLNNPLEYPNIKEFMGAIYDNVRSGARIIAPRTLTIDIPKWTMNEYGKRNANERSWTYLFTGIRYRQSLQSMYDGWPLVFSAFNGGTLGETGGRLSMFHDMGRPLKTFVHNAFRFADLITQASANPHNLAKMVRPRNLQSERKIRRQQERNTSENEVEQSERNALRYGQEQVPSSGLAELERLAGSTYVAQRTGSDAQQGDGLPLAHENDAPVDNELDLNVEVDRSNVELEEDLGDATEDPRIKSFLVRSE